MNERLFDKLNPDQRQEVVLQILEMKGGYFLPLKSNCQECAACCVALSINENGFKKKAGEPCKYLRKNSNGYSCEIYSSSQRPRTCQEFRCDAKPVKTPCQTREAEQLISAVKLMGNNCMEIPSL